GCVNVLDGDIAAYFDSIPHDRLMEQVSRRIADGYILALIRAWLRSGVLEKGRLYHADRGTPQGGVISPLLANIYLHQFDRKWKEDGMEKRYGYNAHLVRYADDFVILTNKSMDAPYEKVKEIMNSLGLTLNEEKTRIIHARDGFDFLGFRFVRRFSKKYGKDKTYRFPSHKSILSVKEKIRKATDKRLNSRNKPEMVVSKVNPILVGWANYFAHVNASKAFRRVQRYCESRFRRYLRYRRHKYGRGYREIPEEFLYEKLGLEDITRGKIHYVMANAASECYRTAV
ncbi:MAG: reverse transcriptase domain-containing protein, partial [Thermoplasmata archaeon]